MTPRVSTNPGVDRRSGATAGPTLRRGFSLIEVVVAVGIFAFVIVGVIGLLGPTSKSVADVMDATVATRLVDSVTSELTRLRDSKANRLDGLAADLATPIYLVATADGSRVLERDTTPPTGVTAIAERDRYFLITVAKHTGDDDPLVYQAGSGFLALTISVQWPYKIPDGEGSGGQEVTASNRSVALYNIALTP